MNARMAWVWQWSVSSLLGFGVEVALFGEGIGECGRPVIGVRGFRAFQCVKQVRHSGEDAVVSRACCQEGP